MKKYFIFSVLLLMCALMSAQEFSPIKQNIVYAKQLGREFKSINNILTIDQNPVRTKGLVDLSKVTLFDYNAAFFKQEIEKEKNAGLSMEIPLDNTTPVILDVLEVPESFYSYQIQTASGIQRGAMEGAKHYRGVVRGKESQSLVALSFFQNEMIGTISVSGQGNYNIGKLKNSNQHIVFNENNIKRAQYFDCETVDDGNSLPYTSDQLFNSDRNRSVGSCLDVYLETDFGMYQHFSNNTADVEQFVLGLFNVMATLYANESLTVELSELFIWDVNDPYNNTNTSTGLSDFVSNRPTFNGDVAQLLTYKSGDGNPNNLSNAGGIANGIGGLCVTGDSNLSPHAHTRLFPDFEEFPIFSRQVKVVTHEMGHNLGSRHTHACVWNGDNTAIDGCADFTEGSCAIPGYPSGGGTIMSYCDRQSVGIDFNLGFGPQPGNVIRNNVLNASCNESCCDPTASSNFSIESDCDSGEFSVSGSAVVGSEVSHYWGLFLTSVEGSTSDTDTIDGDINTSGINPVAPVQWGTSATFSNLSLSNHYYIKHGIWSDGCFTWKETRKAVEEFEGTAAFHFENENGSSQENFCLGEDIYLDGQASQGENRYFIDIWRRPLGSNVNFTNYGSLGWTIGSQVGTINLSEAFANLSTPVYLEPDYEYEVKLAIANLDTCIGWTPIRHRFTLECCTSTLSGEFNIGLTTSGEIQGEVIETYPNIEVEHQWFLLSSPNASGGPYSFVASGQGESFSYANIENDTYYFLIHKVLSDCEDVCYGQSVCRNCDRGCELCGAIDCSVLDEIDIECVNLPAPTGLEVDGFTLKWDPIPGITEYVIQSPDGSDPQIQCLKCKYPISIAPIVVYTNSYTLPTTLRKKCFKWKVAAICDGERSRFSNPACYRGKKVLQPLQSDNFEQIVISPNPTDGNLNFIIETKKNTNVSVEITDFYGVLVHRMEDVLAPNKAKSLLWNGQGILKTGIYFAKFITPNETIIKKIIVN